MKIFKATMKQLLLDLFACILLGMAFASLALHYFDVLFF